MENANKQAEVKDATLKLSLKAKSGYSSTTTYKITAKQWGEILQVCEGKKDTNHTAELLETCKKTRVMLLDALGIFGGGHKVNQVYDMLNKAIDKAEGREVSNA